PQIVAVADQVRSGRERKRESALQYRHAIQAPAADQPAHDSCRVRTELPAFAEWKIHDIAQHESVTHIEAAQRPLVVEIVGLIASSRVARPRLEPCRQRLSI